MSSPLVTLGSFVFTGLESPERIRLTARQRLNIHHLGSGSTAVDSLGNEFEIATFQGIFSGADAMMRIRALEYLRYQGAPLPLRWGSRRLSVIIQKLDLNYITNRWVPYSLSCLVLAAIRPSAVTPISQFTSTASRISDILNVLQEANIPISSEQTNALVELAALNFDQAPAASMVQALELLSSIDHAADLTDPSPIFDLGHPNADAPPASQILEIVTNAGQQATLIVARNLVANVYVTANCVNQ